MARFKLAVPTRDCYAVAVGNVEYRAKDGFVEIDNPKHAALAMKVCSDSVTRSQHGGQGKYCPSCAFHAHAFSKVCPRCGSDLPTV